MDKPVFSIVVPVYNVENYLDRCVFSLVNQSMNNIEIILVDDGSPDSCPQKCDEWAKKDPRIMVIHKKNGGLSDARNVGISKAHGQYILFVDSDDYIEIDTCLGLEKYVQNFPDVICIDGSDNLGKTNLMHVPGNEVIVSGADFLKESLRKKKMPMAAWLYVYKKEYLIKQNLQFKKGILHEDEQFTPRALLVADALINTGLSFYHYEIRENSITTQQDKRKNIKDFMGTANELSVLYEKIEDTELRRRLLDSLVCKYLSLFQVGKAYLYGKNYIHKSFVSKNSYCMKSKFKSVLFCLSPRVYWKINHMVKK